MDSFHPPIIENSVVLFVFYRFLITKSVLFIDSFCLVSLLFFTSLSVFQLLFFALISLVSWFLLIFHFPDDLIGFCWIPLWRPLAIWRNPLYWLHQPLTFSLFRDAIIQKIVFPLWCSSLGIPKTLNFFFDWISLRSQLDASHLSPKVFKAI